MSDRRPATPPSEPGPDFDALLDDLRAERNFDLRGYKRVGLARRVAKRMRVVDVEDFATYRDFLRTHAEEYIQLFNTILINVTTFFRDDEPWAYLRAEVLPRLIEAKAPGDPIRVWCAGCATGQEVYTLAIVLAEALGAEQFRDRVKIYGTDVDDEALAVARQGTYDERDVADLPAELLERYFERDGVRWCFRKDLRRLLIFGRNDLMRDAPISRIDLLTCRNTLMYFDAPTQGRVLARFHFALNEGGVLLLGRAETLLTQTTLFVPLDLKKRVFAKAVRAGGLARRDRGAADGAPPRGPAGDGARSPDGDLREAGFDASTVAQFVVDRGGRMAAVNDRARALFHLSAPDLGRPLQDLEVSYRPFELRSVIDQAHVELRTVARQEVPWRAPDGEQRWFDIVVTPLFAPPDGAPPFGAASTGASVTFTEVTRHKQLEQQLQESQQELEAAYQELQSTNEELETTNEELHSTVEELETTNEELQSTNEELETMNEELQSTNEELQTINDELRQRSDELNQLNDFLDSVFSSVGSAVAVLDPELRVLVWNARAEELWGLRADEVMGLPFLSLDIGFPVARLGDAARAALGGDAPRYEVTLDATNRRGRAIRCRTSVLPLAVRGEPAPAGVIVLMDDPPADEGADA
ncbi:chemotaxis protein CheR [Gemmatimonadetes bacterium T265]|nr:chemotaxis protein CheR [Gemmatimonadetes bacterium T265]